MATMSWDDIRNKKKNTPIKNNSQSNDVWGQIRAARGIQTPQPTQTPQPAQLTPTTPTPETPKQKRYGLFGENSLFNDIKTGVKKLQAKGEQRTRETYGPKTPELQLSKALREEKSAEVTANVFTAPIRFTAGSLGTLVTSYALEKANSNKKYTPKTDAEKLIIGETDIQRLVKQEDLYGTVARATSIPVALTLAAIVENPFIKGTGVGTTLKTSLERAIEKKVISTIGTKELIKLADEAIQAEVKIGKIKPEQALKASSDINNFRVNEITPSPKLLSSKADPLIQEAKKYKSAELIKAQNEANNYATVLMNKYNGRFREMTQDESLKLSELNKKVEKLQPKKIKEVATLPDKYTGTSKDIITGTEYFHATTPDRIEQIAKDGLKINSGAREVMSNREDINPLFFSDDPEHALGFIQDLKNEGLIKENTQGVLLRVRDLPHENLFWDELGKHNSVKSGGSWTFDKNIPAKYVEIKQNGKWQPITDIWNKANQPTVKPITPDIPKDTFTPKVSQRISDQAIADGLVKDAQEFGDLPVQQVEHLKDQAFIMGKIIDEDPELLKEIAKGKATYPGLNPSHAFITVKNQALKNGDLELLRELATSPSAVPQQATEAGRLIQALDESSDDAFKNIKKVVDSRKNAVKDKITREAASIKKQVKKSIPKKDDWIAFLEEIKCK